MSIAQAVKAEQKLARDLAGFEGKWVAVRSHAVVASADTLDGLMRAIKAQNLETDGVFEVIEDGDAVCLY